MPIVLYVVIAAAIPIIVAILESKELRSNNRKTRINAYAVISLVAITQIAQCGYTVQQDCDNTELKSNMDSLKTINAGTKNSIDSFIVVINTRNRNDSIFYAKIDSSLKQYNLRLNGNIVSPINNISNDDHSEDVTSHDQSGGITAHDINYRK